MEPTRHLAFSERGWLVKTLWQEKELYASYKLRHQVYSDLLGWVPKSKDELEIDSYDSWATSIGIFSGKGQLGGMIRLLPSTRPIMIENEFKVFLKRGYRLRKGDDTNEITRLTMDPTLQEMGLSKQLLLILLKGLYKWVVDNGVRYSYMVVEKRVLRGLNLLGFPCKPIGPNIALPPARAVSVAAMLDWDEFRVQNSLRQPEFYNWITDVKTIRHSFPSEALRQADISLQAVGGRSLQERSVA